MKKTACKNIAVLAAGLFLATACVDNQLDTKPKSTNYPFRLVLDAEEGGDLADAEEYGLEIKFADFIGDLPDETVTVDYEIADLSGDMIGSVRIDKIMFENDDEEVELDFTASEDGLTGTITLNLPDDELPESFEVVFLLPGVEEEFYAEGGFTFTLSNLQAGKANMILGTPLEFEYEVLDHELAGSWEYEIESEEELNSFKEIFGSLNHELEALEFSDVLEGESIEVEIEFEFEEANITITYVNDAEDEIEIEIEGEYDFEEGELELEGSHLIVDENGVIEDELDFIVEAEYQLGEGLVAIKFLKVIDEDNFEDGEELFLSESGAEVIFEK
jgi:hypothetical protein